LGDFTKFFQQTSYALELTYKKKLMLFFHSKKLKFFRPEDYNSMDYENAESQFHGRKKRLVFVEIKLFILKIGT